MGWAWKAEEVYWVPSGVSRPPVEANEEKEGVWAGWSSWAPRLCSIHPQFCFSLSALFSAPSQRALKEGVCHDPCWFLVEFWSSSGGALLFLRLLLLLCHPPTHLFQHLNVFFTFRLKHLSHFALFSVLFPSCFFFSCPAPGFGFSLHLSRLCPLPYIHASGLAIIAHTYWLCPHPGGLPSSLPLCPPSPCPSKELKETRRGQAVPKVQCSWSWGCRQGEEWMSQKPQRPWQHAWLLA